MIVHASGNPFGLREVGRIPWPPEKIDWGNAPPSDGEEQNIQSGRNPA
jgi:hypothetical protein